MATPALLTPEETLPSAPSRPRGRSNLWLHGVLLLVTAFSTTSVGMRYLVNFREGRFPLATDTDIFPYHWVFQHLADLRWGLPFSLTLLAILLTHEFGHYFACRYYGIRATLPYLLPAPSLSGTAGAVIRLKSRVKTRKSLLVVGAMGPIAGFLVAIVTACVGFAYSHPLANEPARLVNFQSPLLFRLLPRVLAGPLHLTPGQPLLWHPILVASWIGVLITSLNLVPAGQLDGGHILYAISPRTHKVVTWITMAGLVYLGVRYWLGWLIWTGLLLLPGMRHPQVNDPEPLPTGLWLLAPLSLVILVLCATPQPFDNASLLSFVLRWWK